MSRNSFSEEKAAATGPNPLPCLPLRMPISVQDFSKKLTLQLLELYPEQEASTLVEWLLEYHFGIRRADSFRSFVEEDLPAKFYQDLERLKTGEPIQYILGKAPFYGREFAVTRDTLIPRNETEELVHLIIKENRAPGLRVLDIGTGTGCIPISLFLEMDHPTVHGLDFSKPALQVAKDNARDLGARVSFELCDILSQMPAFANVDILISNPPYVLESDKSQMHQNVLAHEPWSALFVPDEDPLLFYRIIAEKGKQLLVPHGKIYFEIHESQGTAVKGLLENLGYTKARVVQDLNGKNRMCMAMLS